jgi:Protein of unknown function (DUF3455)
MNRRLTDIKHVNRLDRLLVALLAAIMATLVTEHVAQAGPDPPPVPSDIAVPDGHRLFLVGHAVGVQIHTCGADSGSYRWRFEGPRANLYGDHGKLLTTHYAGPSWQAKDGSTVVGALDRPVTVDPTAIPWLRLRAASATAGSDGDRLAGTTYIQRINTTGGLAPDPAACNADTVGTTQEVPYTADYTFWKEIR